MPKYFFRRINFLYKYTLHNYFLYLRESFAHDKCSKMMIFFLKNSKTQA